MTKESAEKSKFLDYLYTIVKWRRLFIINFFIVCIIAAIISLIIPKTYTAKSVILPPTGGNNFISSLTANLPVSGLLGGVGAYSDETNKFLSILKSRTIIENTIKHFDLLDRFGYKNMEEAIRLFGTQVDISVNDESSIVVEVALETSFFHPDSEENEIKHLCANITNFIVSELDKINKNFQTQQAKYNRIFIEKRYNENKEELRISEKNLKNFSEKYGIISLPDQINAAISSASEIESRLMIKEIELEALKSSVNNKHPSILQKQIEIKELKRKLKELKMGTPTEDVLKLYPTFSKAPQIGMQYMRLKREVEIQNIIYEFLTQQYEQAKIQEARDTPTIQVMDEAVPPYRKAKPKRAILVILAGVLSIIVTTLYVFTLEYLKVLEIQNNKKYQKFLYVLRGINIFKKLPSDKGRSN